MKNTLVLLLICMLVLTKCLYAQNLSYTLGWGLTYTYGKIDNKTSVDPNAYSRLVTQPGLSTSWPSISSKLTVLDNILRLGVLSFGTEYRFNNRWSLISGLEIGGRRVHYKEYAKDLNEPEVKEKNLANSIDRSYLVLSLPISVKYKLYEKRFSYSLITGVYFNEAFSRAFSSIFYTTPKGYLFYPTLSAGIRVCAPKYTNFAIEASYQQGLSDATSDKITLYSAKAFNLPAHEYEANSLGSHFRLSLLYQFNRKKKSSQAKATTIPIPFDERTKGNVFKIDCAKDTFRICFEDLKTVDSDSIRIVFNSSNNPFILELKAAPQCLTFDVHNQLVNTIDIYAINEGKVKPNTMTIKYTDKHEAARAIVVNNSLDKFIRIKVIYIK